MHEIARLSERQYVDEYVQSRAGVAVTRTDDS